MRVVDAPIGDIKVEKRARTEMGNLNDLVESIKDKGIIQPIVLSPDMFLLAGERRFRAAQLVGLTTIPAVIRKTSGKLDALEIELLENVARKDFSWVERAHLEKKIYELKQEADPRWNMRKQADLQDSSHGAVGRRIQLAEAMELIPDLATAENEDAAWKEYKKLEESFVSDEMVKKLPDTIRKASRWASDHYIVGDALIGMMASEAQIAHFAEVDPPYGVELDTERKQRNAGRENVDRYTEVPKDEFLVFFERTAKEVFRLLKEHAFAVFWFGSSWHKETLDVLREVGFGVPDIPAIWTKGGSGQTASPDTTLGSTYEPFWLARKGQPKLARVGRGNDFRFDPVPHNKKIHLTQKPIELLEEIISIVCQPGSAIICPFLGSGVTLRAAYRLGHTGFGWDLSKENRDLFLKSVQLDMADAEEVAAA